MSVPAARMSFPAGFTIGWRYTVPLIDMDLYLPYLQARLTAAGGTLRQHPITDLGQAASQAPIVVNATGLGAHNLVGDADLTPIRGQLVVMDNPGITEFFTEDAGWSPDLLHLYPHGDRLILGGVAQDGNWDLEPSERTAEAIIERCAAIPEHREPARQSPPRGPPPHPAGHPVRGRLYDHRLPPSA